MSSPNLSARRCVPLFVTAGQKQATAFGQPMGLGHPRPLSSPVAAKRPVAAEKTYHSPVERLDSGNPETVPTVRGPPLCTVILGCLELTD